VKVHLRQIDAQPKRHVYQKEICIETIHDSFKTEKKIFLPEKAHATGSNRENVVPFGGRKLQAATPLLRVSRSSITLLMHLTSTLV
jgi:hypothetical protein